MSQAGKKPSEINGGKKRREETRMTEPMKKMLPSETYFMIISRLLIKGNDFQTEKPPIVQVAVALYWLLPSLPAAAPIDSEAHYSIH